MQNLMQAVALWVDQELLIVEGPLLTGFYYYNRDVISSRVAAQWLLAYGLMKEGTKRLLEGRIKSGVSLNVLSAVITAETVYSTFNTFSKEEDICPAYAGQWF